MRRTYGPGLSKDTAGGSEEVKSRRCASSQNPPDTVLFSDSTRERTNGRLQAKAAPLDRYARAGELQDAKAIGGSR